MLRKNIYTRLLWFSLESVSCLNNIYLPHEISSQSYCRARIATPPAWFPSSLCARQYDPAGHSVPLAA